MAAAPNVGLLPSGVSKWIASIGGAQWRTLMTLDDPLLRQCDEFAGVVAPTTLAEYIRRRAADGEPALSDAERADELARQTEQHRVSKLGEWATYRALRALPTWRALDEPDMTIRDAAHKSFAPDLVSAADTAVPPVHVKTQELAMAHAFGASWTFERSDVHVFGARRRVDQFVAFCIAVDDRRVLLAAVVPLQALHKQQLFHEMRLARLRRCKQAVYLQAMRCLRTPCHSLVGIGGDGVEPPIDTRASCCTL